jgi:hypothetical protein
MKKIIATLFLVCLFNNKMVHAQSIALEAGFAGVQNHRVDNLGRGISFLLPLSKKLMCDISWYRWQGEDSNYSYLVNKDDNWSVAGLFYGNRGRNMVMLYKIKETRKLAYFIGAGLGHAEFIRVIDSNEFQIEENVFIGTFSLAAKAQYRLSGAYSIYAKAVICSSNFPHGEYAFMNLGLAVTPF